MSIIATFRTSLAVPSKALLATFEHVVEVPPLDERREDIPDIVAALLRRHADGLAPLCTSEAMQDLMRRDWPGNVDQLKRVLHAALSRASSQTIRCADLPSAPRAANTRRALTRLQQAERAAVQNAIVAAGGNRRAAALELGISRSTLYRKIAALGLDT